MIALQKLKEIEELLAKEEIEFRIINNTYSKNLILINDTNIKKLKSIKEVLIKKYQNIIQEIIIEPNENINDFTILEIKKLCKKNSIIHRNTSYLNWNKDINIKTEKISNVISGYSFKGGMGRSTTLAYLSYFYYLMGKKVVVLDCDFEAPGIASIFFDKKTRETKAGILDYLIDLNIDNNLEIEKYFLQNKVSSNSGNLYLFPSGIDFDTKTYINKISKIDFNSKIYTDRFQGLLNEINQVLKPDIIFIDLRAGINESNGYILKNISNDNLLFFNGEEQNQDGLNAILDFIEEDKNNHIINSTIRYSTINPELIEMKEKEFLKIFNSLNIDFDIYPIRYRESMLETDSEKFKKFVNSQYKLYDVDSDFYLKDIASLISNKYFEEEIEVDNFETNVDLKTILIKLESEFSKLIAKQKFQSEDDLKYFYFKKDISRLVNEQIFLILGAKGTGKSTLFEIFTKNFKDVLNKLNVKNNTYIVGFSKDISNEISKDYLKLVYEKSDKKIDDLERFWKALTLYQLEKHLSVINPFFNDINEIKNKFTNLEYGLLIDKRLKEININLYNNDNFITLVYDELDVELTDKREVFIDSLVEFWRGNLYRHSQIKSKILLRNDIFNNLKIENKTHLDFNKYELKWSKDEILSLILKIIITALNEDELTKINLMDIVKSKNELVDDKEKIKNSIYKIFGKKLNETQSNISTMDNWIISYLSDSDEVVTPRVIYKFLSESIKKELESLIVNDDSKNILISNFGKNYKEILLEVSKHKITEYDEEYPKNKPLYTKIKNIGYRIFEYSEFRDTYTKRALAKTINDDLVKLIDSGFIMIKDEKKKQYQVSNVYVPVLEIKANRQGRRK